MSGKFGGDVRDRESLIIHSGSLRTIDWISSFLIFIKRLSLFIDLFDGWRAKFTFHCCRCLHDGVANAIAFSASLNEILQHPSRCDSNR